MKYPSSFEKMSPNDKKGQQEWDDFFDLGIGELFSYTSNDNDGKTLMNKRLYVNRGDAGGSTAMHKAATNGHYEVTELLLKAGALPNSKDNRGRTPLHCAATKGHIEVAKLLLRSGGSIDTKANNGWTPLHDAACAGQDEMVKMLLSAGANNDLSDANGSTPLHRAATNGHSLVVHLLLNAGASTDSKDNNGWCPLQKAAACGHEDIVKLFMKTYPYNQTVYNGRTPLLYAKRFHHHKVVDLLLEYGANDESEQMGRNQILQDTNVCASDEDMEYLLEDRLASLQIAQTIDFHDTTQYFQDTPYCIVQ